MANLVEVLFALESTQFPAETIERARQSLDQLIGTLRVAGLPGGTPYQQAHHLKRVIFGKLGYGAERRESSSQFTLTGTLLKRVGCCLGLTTLYVCAGEALGVSLRPMLFEGHIAVGHAAVSPPLWIETMRFGHYWSPADFRTVDGRPSESSNAPRLLTDPEFVAVHLSNRAAFVLAPESRFRSALYLTDTALELFPDYLSAWINRAALSLELGDRRSAEESLAEAAGLKPRQGYRCVIDQLQKRLDRDQ